MYLKKSQATEKETSGSSAAFVVAGSFSRTLLALNTDTYSTKLTFEVISIASRYIMNSTFDFLAILIRAKEYIRMSTLEVK